MNIKTILLVVALSMMSVYSYSQKKLFIGAWELKSVKNSEGEVIKVPSGLYKIFDNSGKFSNMRYAESGSILAHYGDFSVDSKVDYKEIIKEDMLSVKSKKKTIKLKYKFSEDGQTLSLEGEIPINDSDEMYYLFEEWRKVVVGEPDI